MKAIWIVNMINMLFWFIAKPSNNADTIKTIVTSMAAVLTTTMTLRIILSVRGSLVRGGSFAGSSTGAGSAGSRHTTHVVSRHTVPGSAGTPGVLNINSQIGSQGIVHQTYTIDEMNAKPGSDWADNDGKSSVKEDKEGIIPADNGSDSALPGVKITVDKEIAYPQ